MTRYCKCLEPMPPGFDADDPRNRGKAPCGNPELHRRREEFCARHGYYPYPPAEREYRIVEGTRFMAPTFDLRTRTRGADIIVTAHFHGSIAQAIVVGMERSHPTRDAYLAMLPLDQMFPSEVVQELRQMYGSPPTRGSVDASLMWHPPTSAAARQPQTASASG